MTIIIVDAKVTTSDEGLRINASSGENVVKTELLPGEVSDVGGLAEWLLNQTLKPQTADVNLQRRLTISYHIEQAVDPESGLSYDYKQIDNVASEQLPFDAGMGGFSALTGWSSWTASEAEDWITENVVDLASAKTALMAMAKAIVFLRNVVVD